MTYYTSPLSLEHSSSRLLNSLTYSSSVSTYRPLFSLLPSAFFKMSYGSCFYGRVSFCVFTKLVHTRVHCGTWAPNCVSSALCFLSEVVAHLRHLDILACELTFPWGPGSLMTRWEMQHWGVGVALEGQDDGKMPEARQSPPQFPRRLHLGLDRVGMAGHSGHRKGLCAPPASGCCHCP